MRRALPVIHESVEELRARLRRARDAETKRRLHLLVLLAEGTVRDRQQAAAHLAVHRMTVGSGLARYERAGLAGLLERGRPGARAGQRLWSAAAWTALPARLQHPEGFGGYREIQRWLAEEWGVELAYHSVHRLVHRRLSASPKRPRPTHPKKNSRTPPTFQPVYTVPLMPSPSWAQPSLRPPCA